MVVMINVFAINRIGVAATLLTTAMVLVGCGRSSDDRVPVPTSDPQIACTSVEGPGASRAAEAAIASARAAWTSIHEKTSSSDVYSPANMAKFEPYTATLNDGVWQVRGTVPPGYLGFVPITSVCKNDEGVSTAWIEVR
jgi:hypothetical protein